MLSIYICLVFVRVVFPCEHFCQMKKNCKFSFPSFQSLYRFNNGFSNETMQFDHLLENMPFVLSCRSNVLQSWFVVSLRSHSMPSFWCCGFVLCLANRS